VGSERYCIFRGEGAQGNCPALKVRRQCPLVVLLVEVGSRERKTLGSGKEVLGCGLCYAQRS
jgi:hypothetical protein